MKDGRKLLEVYIHIPFCVKKCNYCDFLSAPCAKEQQEEYMAALFAEIEGRAKEYQEYIVTSVFIGGGTPSVPDAKWIAGLMERIRECYVVESGAEITIEVNPGTADEEKLAAYFKAGINRLSIGLQSANNGELQKLGRVHTYEQFLETYYGARRVGFSNINVDVMSALPGQNPATYQYTLQRILELSPRPEHVSAYSLIVEEGTPFAQWYEKGELDLPDEECERQMYEETKQILGEAGFYRYEISNYAREGFECRHNCGYWQRREYVGFGIGAASLINNTRFSNHSDLQRYLKEPLKCREDLQELSQGEQMEETMFLGLRMTSGVSPAEFAECYGKGIREVYGDIIDKNVRDGLLTYKQGEKGQMLALTEKGLDVSNYVMAQFLLDEK